MKVNLRKLCSLNLEQKKVKLRKQNNQSLEKTVYIKLHYMYNQFRDYFIPKPAQNFLS